MNQITAEQVVPVLREMLRNLTNNSPVLGAAIFYIEGHPLVSHFYGGADEIQIAAMIAGMYSAAEQSAEELHQGTIKSIVVECNYGTTVVIAMDRFILTVTAPENAKLGLVFNDAKKVAREAGRILREVREI